jgi:hypothetical protein
LSSSANAACSERLLWTTSHEEAWIELADDELQDLQAAVPELQVGREPPRGADWEIKATITAHVPDEQSGRRVGPDWGRHRILGTAP